MSEMVIPPRLARRYMNYMIVSAVVWYFFGVTISGPIFSGLLLSLNLSKAQIGVVMSLALLFLPMQMLGALVQRRFFHRKRFWIFWVLIHYTSFLGIAVIAGWWLRIPQSLALGLFMAAYALSQFAAQIAAPSGWAWTGEIVPVRESAAFWNRRNGLALLASMAAGILMGKLVDVLGQENRSTYAITMAIGVFFGYLSMFSNFVMPDPDPLPQPHESPWERCRSVWRNRQFRWITAFFSFQSLAAWVSSGFIFVYLQRDMGFSMTAIQVLSAAACAVGFFAACFFRIIGSKYGHKPVLILCSVLKAGEFVLYGTLLPGNGMLDELGVWALHALAGVFGRDFGALPPGLIGTLPVFMLGGFVNIGLGASQMAIITSSGNRQDRSFAIGLFYSLVGITGFVMSSQSGVLYEYFDSLTWIGRAGLTSFNVLALITAVGYFASVLLLAPLREDGAAPTVEVVRNVFSANPIRAVYHAYLLSRPMTELGREETLRHAHGNLIARELIAGLYSPSSRIRDGALLNICRLEGEIPPELGLELINLLEVPELGMQAMAARTLGRLRIAAATPALIRHFLDPDQALAQACIFAAGLIGDPAAEDGLLEVLAQRSGVQLWPLAAEALSRIGDRRHVRRVFPVLAAEQHPVVRRQLLISLCRLLMPQAKTAIYAAFEAEEHLPGAEIEKGMRQSVQHPVWKAAAVPVPDFERLIAVYDRDDCVSALELLLVPLLALYGVTPPAEGEVGTFLRERFAVGRMREEAWNGDSLPAVGIWLELKLWAELRYNAGGPDRFLLLAALLILPVLLDARLAEVGRKAVRG